VPLTPIPTDGSLIAGELVKTGRRVQVKPSSVETTSPWTVRPSGVPPQHYVGAINKFGVDIGYLQGGVIVWTVVAPTANLAPGSLSGTYAGATGSATVGVGVGANVLVGGSGNSIALQPISIEGTTGLNVAAGIAEMTLTFQPG